MSLVVAVLLAALLLGRLGGGSLERLGDRPLRRRRLVVAALLVQAAGSVLGGPAHPLGLAASAGLAAAFLLANRGLRGTGLVALGLGANALVVALNGAMPVSPQAAARAGVPLLAVEAGLDRRHVLEGPDTRLAALGDVVPVLLPLRPEVVSPGDVLVAAGLGQLVVVGMLSGAAASVPPSSEQPPSGQPQAARLSPPRLRAPVPGPARTPAGTTAPTSRGARRRLPSRPRPSGGRWRS